LDELRAQFFRARPEERKKLRADITAQERRIVATSLREKAEAQQQIIDRYGRLAAQTNGKLKASDERKLNAAVEKLAHLTRLQDDMAQPDYTPPFFLYRLHFSEVFERKGGFDVVVANPPYVDAREITEQKPELKLAYPKVYSGTADLYVFFYARAYELLKSGGQLSFITSNKYMRTGYGKNLRKFLSSEVLLKIIIDFGDLPVFDAAAYPCIVIAIKQRPYNNFVHGMPVRDIQIIENLAETIESQAAAFLQSELGEDMWQLVEESSRELMQGIWQKSISLQEYVDGNFYRGVTTGLNDAFEIDEDIRTQLVAAQSSSAEIIKPWIRGRNVKRWSINWNQRHILFTRQGIEINNYHAVYDYLLQYKDKLTPGIPGGRKPGTYEWFEIQDNTAYYQEFEKSKIVWAKYGIEPAFTYDSEGYFAGNTVFILPTDDLFLLAILNSKVTQWYATHNFNLVRGGYIEWIPANVGQLPIPNPPDELRQRIAALAQQCLDAAQDAPDTLPTLEAELNALVYQAYG
ncbi:MAG: Eco57I restriction-modification methylase domain-containing protein, partial [Taibaiella sp.]|nr:Eco57I restriction-modification methylase domain-containing protein [Taibaiella sp.]